MPMQAGFQQRLLPNLREVAAHFGTPFHIYDEDGIRQTANMLKSAFVGVEGFREYFAVKALPNPRILSILHDCGFGFDCSSIPELILGRGVGAHGDDLFFTSNNTSREEFEHAFADGGCILNLDDLSLLDKLPHIPEQISFRYNPGERRTGNAIIGKPAEAKFGLSHEQLLPAYRRALSLGIRRFGLHAMIVSNERDYRSMVETAGMLLECVESVQAETGIRFDFINLGGGLGIPYRPEDSPLNLDALGREIRVLVDAFRQRHGYVPAVFTESGRFITGPHGVLVTRVLNQKNTYRRYIGVDASMSALMRPGMYGAYHHIEVPGKPADGPSETVDVVGSLCENNDKFAIQRSLPTVVEGDLLIIHDTGAHGHAMGFNYNGRLRPQELLLRPNGQVERIRRAETLDDYFATLNCHPQPFHPKLHPETV